MTLRFSAEYLREFTIGVFRACGMPATDSAQAAEVLSASDVRGIESHGVARLHAYVRLFDEGLMNPRPQVTVVRESPSTATIDGDDGLGLVVGPQANQIAMDKADAVGTGWVAVRNTHHFGIAGYYPLQALQRDMIGWAMTNATSQVALQGGSERMLGTNPIAIAFPGSTQPPIVIDMATSVVAYGKIEMHGRKGIPLPHGWALDSNGEVGLDANELGPDYALLPLGSDQDRSGHKGTCLGAMVDILCGPLGGANWGPFAPPLLTARSPHHGTVGKGIGHFFGAMKIDAFIEVDEFKQQVDAWIAEVRKAKKRPDAEQGPLVPGDPERACEADRRENGVPLVQPVIEALTTIGKKLDVPFDIAQGK